MNQMLQLSVQKREQTGKGPSRRLRAERLVPGVFYNGKGENQLVQAEYVPLEKAWEQLGSNKIFELKIEGSDEVRPALIWKIVREPVKGFFEHVDFYGVDMTAKMRITVPVQITGEPVGVKIGGGLLEVFRDHLEIECLPSDIPGSIVIDVTHLKVGDNIHVENLKVPSGVQVIFDEHFAVVGVIAKSADDEKSKQSGEAG